MYGDLESKGSRIGLLTSCIINKKANRRHLGAQRILWTTPTSGEGRRLFDEASTEDMCPYDETPGGGKCLVFGKWYHHRPQGGHPRASGEGSTVGIHLQGLFCYYDTRDKVTDLLEHSIDLEKEATPVKSYLSEYTQEERDFANQIFPEMGRRRDSSTFLNDLWTKLHPPLFP